MDRSTSILTHLQDRYMDVKLHRPVVDEGSGTATFYLWNLSGQLVGYQRYNPAGKKTKKNDSKVGKYYTYRKAGTICVWGLESLDRSNKVIYITEGIFDAARLTYAGQSALAVMTNNPPEDYKNWIDSLGKPTVTVCDNDKAGDKLSRYGTYAEVVIGGKDIGEAPEDYVRCLIKKYQ